VIRVQQRPTPHVTEHPIPRDVRACVLHVVEGSATACESWFANPASKVSAHFLVHRDGQLTQYVSIHDIAWHAGRVFSPRWKGVAAGNPNRWTVGVEHEGTGVQAWTEAQLLTSAMLGAWLCRRFKWTPSADVFPMHREIYALKTCPGPSFNRDAYLDRVRAVLATVGDEIPTLFQGLR
jgi:N-acetylmuramoyl-L-alanine amidase